MEVDEALAQLGGVATRRQLLRHVSVHHLERSVAAGDLVRAARGRYALPNLGAAEAALGRVGGTLAGPGCRAARRVAAAASPKKANVLESVLHALVLDQPGLDVEPQAPIDLGGRIVHPDLVDRSRRLVFEAEGWLYHGSTPESFDSDVERYTLLTLYGWRVIRFTHHQDMRQTDWVREVLATLASTCTMPRLGLTHA